MKLPKSKIELKTFMTIPKVAYTYNVDLSDPNPYWIPSPPIWRSLAIKLSFLEPMLSHIRSIVLGGSDIVGMHHKIRCFFDHYTAVVVLDAYSGMRIKEEYFYETS